MRFNIVVHYIKTLLTIYMILYIVLRNKIYKYKKYSIFIFIIVVYKYKKKL